MDFKPNMEFLSPLPTQLCAVATSLLVLLLILYFLVMCKSNTPNFKPTPPEPSGAWPLIGHLPLLGELPHLTLGKLADHYGPIFMIKLGVNQTLVVSSSEMAKECLGINGKVFVNRPHTVFVKHLAYNSAMLGFSSYGKYWRVIRKITTVEFLGNHRIEKLKNVKITEVKSAMKVLEDHCKMNTTTPETVDMKEWFNDVTMNTIVRLVSGKSMKEFYQGDKYNQCAKAFRDFFEFAGTFVLADALPFLKWLDIGGYEKKMKKLANEVDQLPQKWLEDHRKRRASKEAKETQDFMDVMLDIFETGQDNSSNFEADTIIKANCMNMILAATDTTAATLTWALSLLLNNQQVLKKSQAELDTVVGKQRQVEESDLQNLVYLQAILKETMRLYPAGPLSVPREAIADCTVGGYHISAGTQLYVNLYKIHRDPKVWADPLKFQPERFLTTQKDYDFGGQNYELMPFGNGRRICPGISFALQSMQFTLSNLLHRFEISLPSDGTVDMTEGFGLSNLKATPLEVILKNRLPHNL